MDTPRNIDDRIAGRFNIENILILNNSYNPQKIIAAVSIWNTYAMEAAQDTTFLPLQSHQRSAHNLPSC